MIDRAPLGSRLHTMLPVRLVAAALVAVVVLGMWIPGAGSQTGGSEVAPPITPFKVTSVDARSSTVELSLIGLDADTMPDSVTLSVNDQEVPVATLASVAEAGRPMELVVVVDTNVRAVAGDVFEVIKAGVAAEVAQLPSDTSVGIVTAGDSALVASNLTTDHDKVITAIGGLTARNGSALFNAIDRAGSLFSDDPETVKSLLVISTGADTGSEATMAEARVGVLQKGVQVLTVGYHGGEGQLAETVARTAGLSFPAASAEDLQPALSAVFTAAADRTLVTFDEPADVGARIGVVLEAEGETIAISYPAGVQTLNSLQLAPLAVEAQQKFAFFNTSTGLYVAIGLAFIGISLGVWSLGSVVAGGDVRLEGMLARYTDGTSGEEADVEELVVQNALLQRAIDFSESFAEKQGFLARVEDLLEQASLPVRAGEAMFILAAITILSGSFGLVLTGSAVAAALIAVFGTGMAFFVVRLMGRRRFQKFESQLPDTLQLLSGTLRAGYSLPQGLDAVSNEIADPMGEELRRAMTEVRLGRELEDALTGVSERLSSGDFAWTVMAISIQREVGGNLNELLMSVSDTMVARERLKREVAALTAEGRVSAAVLSFLPPGLGLVMWVMNPGYVALLFSETMGNIMLALGVVSALVGLAWMKKVITVDV